MSRYLGIQGEQVPLEAEDLEALDLPKALPAPQLPALGMRSSPRSTCSLPGFVCDETGKVGPSAATHDERARVKAEEKCTRMMRATERASLL